MDERCSPRTTALDLIVYDDLVMHDEALTLPHPDIVRPLVYFPLVKLLTETPREASQGLVVTIRRLLPAVAPTGPPGEPLDGFTEELRQLLRR